MLDAHSHRLAVADMLRALAIFAVVLDHLTLALPYDGFLGAVSTLGLWGVNCFFVLTGFLLVRPYLEAILDSSREQFPSTRLFFVRRFYRLVPLYAFAVILTACAALIFKRPVTLGNVVAHLTFMHGYFPQYEGEPFGPLWTMAVDAQFYLCLPLLGYVLHRALRGRSKSTATSAICATLVLSVIASLVWRYFIMTHNKGIFLDPGLEIVYVHNVIGLGSSFAFGTALALVAVLKIRVPQWICVAALALGVALIVPFCMLGVRNDWSNVVYGDLVGGLSAVLLLGALVEGRFESLAGIARARTTTIFAALSYSVYLFHKPIIVAVHEVLVKHGHGKSLADAPLLIVLVAVALAVIAPAAHHFVEKPFLKLRNRSREAPKFATEKPRRSREKDDGDDAGRVAAPISS